MTTSELITVAAIVCGPILAVQAQKWIEAAREKRNRRLFVFKRLMATRGAQVSPGHVEALNMIDLEFAGRGKKNKAVRDRWREYLDHLNSLSQDPEQQRQQLVGWIEKNGELLATLLCDMGKPLGYDFNVVDIRRGVYAPIAHANFEIEMLAIRRFLVDLSESRKDLPVSIRSETELPRTLNQIRPP